ncbi:phospholipase D-like domain-containing protein [Stenotrophomonas maltophilia]|uniref:phospholipase D-like domain-containing protein n=1 Tax=Stenotrophomonas maltophilia TaxID=40324 RepID=UPI0009C0ADD9|nr:phospholipase D-like domain-containing protein [Stenotrophomonas maltophilia]
MSDLESIAQRLDRRDEYRLIAYREVGLPVFRVNCAITFQEASQLGAIEEFMLKSIARGVDSIGELERFLGLPSKVVISQLGQLVFENAVASCTGDPIRYSLTAEGSRRLATAASYALERQRIPVYVDGITRQLVALDHRELWTSKQLDPVGVIPPVERRLPRAVDIDLAQVNRMAALVARIGSPTRRAVRLDAIIGKPTMLFRRALAAGFKSQDGRRISIAFAIDGRVSMEHEIAYQRSGSASRSPLFSTLLDADKRRREVQIVAREFRRDVQVVEATHSEQHQQRPLLTLTGTEAISVTSAKVRTLGVYDHPPLLRNAMDRAQTRLLIISPWIRAAVVDEAFIKRLTTCLDRGVEVTVAYGLGREDAGERAADRQARESLEALATTFQNFRLVRKGNTHAKVLLVDSAYFVTTSFNWLSFRGDLNQPMREEEGTMVEDESAVADYYASLIKRLSVDPTMTARLDRKRDSKL